MKTIKIFIATHKLYEFPQDNNYQPIHVGKAINQKDLGIEADNSGINISNKNDTFCELTALYWVWKNNIYSEFNYIGLVHYRRYFSGSNLSLQEKNIASSSELLTLMSEYDCIVSKKRNYYIETVYSHYKNSHFIKDLDSVRSILETYHRDYISAFDNLMRKRNLSLYNMFVMNSDSFNEYCNWLFDILFKLEQKIDISDYDNYQRRVFGFIAERLFNVWLLKNSQLKIYECAVCNIEGEAIFKKALNLIKRKFIGK